MRVTSNMIINDLKRNMNSNLQGLDLLQRQLSTGKKINLPSDNPAGLIKSLRLRTNLGEGQQYLNNIGEAVNFMQTTDDSLTNMSEILQRVRELTVKAATGTNESRSRQAIAKEIGELREQLQMIANASYGAKHLFAGTNVTEAPWRGNLWRGNEESLELEIGVGVNIPINLNMKSFFVGGFQDQPAIDNSSGIKGVGASRLQEGEYHIGTELAVGDLPSTVRQAQHYLTSPGNHGHFFYEDSGQAASLGVGTGIDPVTGEQTSDSSYSGSLLLEVKSVDAASGKVLVKVKGHMYKNSGNWSDSYKEIELDNVELDMQAAAGAAGPPPQAAGAIFTLNQALTGLDEDLVFFNSGSVDLGGLDHQAPGDPPDKVICPELAVGDKTILSFCAQGSAGAQKTAINYSFQDREGQEIDAGVHSFQFSAGMIDDQNPELKFFTLDARTGLSYDGSITLQADTLATASEAASFTYQAGIFDFMTDLARKIEVGKLPEVGNELSGNDQRVNELLMQRATVGARINRLELQQNRLEKTRESFTSLLAQNEDADLAELIMNLNMQENVYRASLAAGARIIQPTLMDFLR